MLKENYKNFLYDGNRKYILTQDAQGYTEIQDVTPYTQIGDNFGANDINAINHKVNKMNSVTTITIPADDPLDSPYTEETDSDSNTYYTIEINVTGMTSSYTGIRDMKPVYPRPYNVDGKAKADELAELIQDGDSLDGKIKLYLSDKPTEDFQMYLYGV